MRQRSTELLEPAQTLKTPSAWAGLPGDVASLKALVLAERQHHAAQYQALEAKYQSLETRHQESLALIEGLQHQLQALLRRQFGRRSEKQTSGKPPKPSAVQSAERKGRNGRRPLPEDLPRDVREYDLPDDARVCSHCGGALHRIGEAVTEQLDYVPATVRVRQHVQFKYGCRQCELTVKLAEKPASPIAKGLATAPLLAQVLIAKYQDHIPLHRQEQIFARHGIDLVRSTLCDWVCELARLLRPLVDLLAQQIRAAQRLHSDDTTVQVQVPDKPGKTHQGRLWVYIGCWENKPPAIVYQYTPTRSQTGPVGFLKGYQGDLQADAYAGYDVLFKDGQIIEVACWAHVRRKFYDCALSDPTSTRAKQALDTIQELYKIERDAKALSCQHRATLRQETAKPILDGFKAQLDEWAALLLPKSPLGMAVAYALKLWPALNRYLDNGFLEIDNNRAERAIKPLALGRKNWLFAGSHQGAENAAVIYSLIETCKAGGIEAFDYFADVLERLPTYPTDRLHELLPALWQQSRDGPIPTS